MYSRSRDRVRFRESLDTEPDFGGKTLVRRWPGIVSPSAALCLRQSEFLCSCTCACTSSREGELSATGPERRCHDLSPSRLIGVEDVFGTVARRQPGESRA